VGRELRGKPNLLVQVALPGNAGQFPGPPAGGCICLAWHYDSLSPHAELEGFCEAIAGQRGFTRKFGGISEQLFRPGTTLARKSAASCRWWLAAGVCRGVRGGKRGTIGASAVGGRLAGWPTWGFDSEWVVTTQRRQQPGRKK